jgi:hypothetical protein
MANELHLWVSNQVGVDTDCTTYYLRGAGWTAPEGVALDAEAQILSGDNPYRVWSAYRSLLRSVANRGHGLDSVEAEKDAGEPNLTATPAQLREHHFVSSAESLARTLSPKCTSWTEFVRRIPGLSLREPQ